MSATVRISAHVEATEAEGPHRRFAIWVQGCSLRCPNCCNPEMFESGGGRGVEIRRLLGELESARDHREVEGLTLLGGEPLEQLSAVTQLAQGARKLGLGVLLFTGHRLEGARQTPGFSELWHSVDTMVDGPYVHTRPDRSRRYIGSTNQRIVHRTLRYANPQLWRGPSLASVEIDSSGQLTVTGFPVPVQRLVRALNTC